MESLRAVFQIHGDIISFSPLAGIRFVERKVYGVLILGLFGVSVPLRGLGSWKEKEIEQMPVTEVMFQSPCGD